MVLGLPAATVNRFVEGLLIVCVGLYMHLSQISVMQEQKPHWVKIVPNAASALFVFSMLCILVKMRPSWTAELGQPQRFLLWLVELSVILFVSECAVRYFWHNALIFLNYIYNRLGTLNKVIPTHMSNKVSDISSWLEKDIGCFYILRFLFASVIFIIMLDVTDARNYFRDLTNKLQQYESGDFGVDEDMESSLDSEQYDMLEEELRPVPESDILNSASRLRSLYQRGIAYRRL